MANPWEVPLSENKSVELKEKKEKKEAIARTTVYINAGGRGTRFESVFPKGPSGVTKALIEFSGQPMVQNHVNLIQQMGFRNVIVGAGDYYNVKEYFEGRENDRLSVINTKTQEDTAGDLIKAVRESENFGTNVLVENVDTIAYIKDLGELILQHEKSGADATIVLTTRKGVPNEGAFFVDETTHKITFCGEAREELRLTEPEDWQGFRGSSTGIVLLNTEMLRNFEWQPGEGCGLSIYRDLLPQLVKEGKAYAYNNENNIFTDTGTPEKYNQIKRHEDKIFGSLEKRYRDQL